MFDASGSITVGYSDALTGIETVDGTDPGDSIAGSQADGNGAATRTQFAMLSATLTPTATDFVVI